MLRFEPLLGRWGALALPGLISPSLGGCALEAGDPWGEVEVALSVGFAETEGRLDEAGRLRTLRNFRVEVEALTVTVRAVELIASADVVARFDPANPPTGYSNCHNGHCHHDDGRLVDYADIAAELAGGATGAATLGVLGGATATVAGAGEVALALGTCEADAAVSGPRPSGCVLDAPGAVAGARISLDQVSLSGRFFDGLSGDSARLPVGGVPFAVSLGGVADAAIWRGFVEVGEAFGPGLPANRAVRLALSLDAGAFDGIDVAALAGDPVALSGAVEAAVEGALALARQD
jgi:hypothetical protein